MNRILIRYFVFLFLTLNCVAASRLRVSTLALGNNTDVLLDFESGNGGDLVTAAYFQAMQKGPTNWVWSQSRVPEHTKVWGTNQLRLTTSVLSNVFYSGSGTRGLVFDLNLAETNNSTPKWEFLQATPPASLHSSNFVVSGVSMFNVMGEPSFDVDHINLAGGSYVTLQQTEGFGGTAGNLHIETQVSGVTYKSTTIGINTNTWYDWELRATNGNVSLVVINHTNGTLVGTSGKINCDFVGPVVYVKLQDYLTFTGGFVLHDNISFSYTDPVFPRNDVGSFTPTIVICDQPTNSFVRLTWTGLALLYRVERMNTGVWTTISPSQETRFYNDTNVVDGQTYQYRVTGMIGSVESSAAVGPSLTINNNPGGSITLWQQQTNAFGSVSFVQSQDQIASMNIKGIQSGMIGIAQVSIHLAFMSVAGPAYVSISSGVNNTGTIYGYSAYYTISSTGWNDFGFFIPPQIPANTDFYFNVLGNEAVWQISTMYESGGYLPGEGYLLYKNGVYTGTGESCAKFQIYTK